MWLRLLLIAPPIATAFSLNELRFALRCHIPFSERRPSARRMQNQWQMYPKRRSRMSDPFLLSESTVADRDSPTDDNDKDPVEESRNTVSKSSSSSDDKDKLGGYDPYEKFGGREINVGDPQIKLQEKERSVTTILKELAAIQQQGPQKYCILGTRHCSFLHQQIIELL